MVKITICIYLIASHFIYISCEENLVNPSELSGILLNSQDCLTPITLISSCQYHRALYLLHFHIYLSQLTTAKWPVKHCPVNDLDCLNHLFNKSMAVLLIISNKRSGAAVCSRNMSTRVNLRALDRVMTRSHAPFSLIHFLFGLNQYVRHKKLPKINKK